MVFDRHFCGAKFSTSVLDDGRAGTELGGARGAFKNGGQI